MVVGPTQGWIDSDHNISMIPTRKIRIRGSINQTTLNNLKLFFITMICFVIHGDSQKVDCLCWEHLVKLMLE